MKNIIPTALLVLDDPTIFQIVQCLRENQNSTEKILRSQRDEQSIINYFPVFLMFCHFIIQVLKHQKEIEKYTKSLAENELAHTVALAKIQHAKELKDIDKSIILKLNSIVTEQQTTLFKLNVSLFYQIFSKH